MTTTRQHIGDLDVETWARLTRRAAVDAVAAAERLGIQPRAESIALARMSERELVEHRERSGPPAPRRSLAMQLVEADHLRQVAEGQARDAYQGRRDAEAAASLARTEAEYSAGAATAASERARAVEVEVARVTAGAAADVAAAEERARAAEARAVERSTERTTERAAGEKTVQHLQAEIARVSAGAAADVAAAEEKARAAEARAEQRSTERTTERATGEEAVQRVRLELERVRSDAAAEVAAAHGQASADVAAGQEAADAEIAAARQAAAAEVARWQAHAANMERWARGTVSTQMLTIPIPPWELRNRIGTVEITIDALYQIDYVMEVGLAEEVESRFVPDLEFTRNLAWKVQQQAADLTRELANLPSRYTEPPQVEVASRYAQAAGDAYRAILQRIDAAIERLGGRFHSPDAEIIAAVTAMLTELRAQGLY